MSFDAIARRCGLVAVLCCACGGPTLEVLERDPESFVERDGRVLVDRGEPYRFVGYDAYTLTGCGPNPASDEDTRAFFAGLRRRSMIRTYAFEPLGLSGVERVVTAARDHGHLLTLVLTDHESSCAEGEISKTSEFYAGGFRDSYLPWVRRVVSRFASEAAVAFWEPVKAPRDVDAATLRAFYDAVGGEIHGLDRNHLVQAGTHGPWAYGGDEGYALIADSAGVDVLTFHDYDNQRGPPANLEATVRAAAPAGKPVVLAELGLFAGLVSGGSFGPGGEPCIDWDQRRDAIEVKLDAAFAASLAGVLVWNWSPVGGIECGFVISENDPTYELVRSYPLP